MPLVVGITGGIGAGKTTVTDIFEELGISVVDADLLSREVVAVGSPTLNIISQHFGSSILLTDGSLNRSKLRSIVFTDDVERRWLESVTHPAIRKLTEDRLTSASSPYVVLSSPLLLETDQHTLVDHIVVVDIPVEQQIERASRRDAQSTSQIQAIIEKQISRTDRLARANHIIDNSESIDHTRSQVQALHQAFTIAAKARHSASR